MWDCWVISWGNRRHQRGWAETLGGGHGPKVDAQKSSLGWDAGNRLYKTRIPNTVVVINKLAFNLILFSPKQIWMCSSRCGCKCVALWLLDETATTLWDEVYQVQPLEKLSTHITFIYFLTHGGGRVTVSTMNRSPLCTRTRTCMRERPSKSTL